MANRWKATRAKPIPGVQRSVPPQSAEFSALLEEFRTAVFGSREDFSGGHGETRKRVADISGRLSQSLESCRKRARVFPQWFAEEPSGTGREDREGWEEGPPEDVPGSSPFCNRRHARGLLPRGFPVFPEGEGEGV